ncbi:MAG: phosphatidate cytidylyltransferase [Candidatus Saccharibacteria bacterium]|nr:phosphatidate cytidylyltransferase [Candidatus Saccharibacteria bacterium]
MTFILTILAIGTLLVVNELFWRKHAKHGEFSRKFIHITVGSFVAFWPFFLSWVQIGVLSIAFLLVVAVSKYFKLFKAIHSVQRPTYGEVFFALAVGLIAIVTHDKYIYAVALLQMSLADGMAAVMGTKFGKSQRYYVFGQAKSVAGSLTFFVVSVVLLAGYDMLATPIGFGLLLVTALSATFIENIGVQGMDNILVPLLVAGLLVLN